MAMLQVVMKRLQMALRLNPNIGSSLLPHIGADLRRVGERLERKQNACVCSRSLARNYCGLEHIGRLGVAVYLWSRESLEVRDRGPRRLKRKLARVYLRRAVLGSRNCMR